MPMSCQIVRRAVSKVLEGTLKSHHLERHLDSPELGVRARRLVWHSQGKLARSTLRHVPWINFDYDHVRGRNCEEVVGYVPVPVGITPRLTVNGSAYYVPLATTEGALVASVGRGCKVIDDAGGCHATVVDDKMTRAPLLECASLSVFASGPADAVLLPCR